MMTEDNPLIHQEQSAEASLSIIDRVKLVGVAAFYHARRFYTEVGLLAATSWASGGDVKERDATFTEESHEEAVLCHQAIRNYRAKLIDAHRD
jgi:hypothetical protein